MSMTHRLVVQFDRAIAALEAAQPAAQLLARLYVAKVFLLSGLTKVRDWDITLALFADEYQVPLLSPTLAAWLGTGAELLLPVLLALGSPVARPLGPVHGQCRGGDQLERDRRRPPCSSTCSGAACCSA